MTTTKLTPPPLGRLIADLPGTELTAADMDFIQHPQLAGLIFFSRNFEDIDQFKELVKSIRSIRPELILAIDQEGGRVQRIKAPLSILPPLGDCLAQGRTLEQAKQWLYDHAWLMASEILSLDIDISYSPVLDLNFERSVIIGNRALCQSPDQLILLASAYLEGLKKAGMAATGKHFPGHGYVTLDSHETLPIDPRSLNTLEDHDLKPFLALLDDLPAIMTAHIIYQNIDGLPVAFSEYWISTYLKGKYQYKGIVVSDDLDMAGARQHCPDPAQRALLAITAGCDLLLNCNNTHSSQLMLDALEQQQTAPLPIIAQNKLKAARGWFWEDFQYNEARLQAQTTLSIHQPLNQSHF